MMRKGFQKIRFSFVGPEKLALGPWFVEDRNQNGGAELCNKIKCKIVGEPVNVF